MRYLLALAVLVLGSYILINHRVQASQVQASQVQARTEQPEAVSLAYLSQSNDSGIAGHTFVVTGAVRDHWRVGDLMAVRLTQRGVSVIVLGRGAPALKDGQVLALVVEPTPIIPFGGFTSPLVVLVVDWGV